MVCIRHLTPIFDQLIQDVTFSIMEDDQGDDLQRVVIL